MTIVTAPVQRSGGPSVAGFADRLRRMHANGTRPDHGCAPWEGNGAYLTSARQQNYYMIASQRCVRLDSACNDLRDVQAVALEVSSRGIDCIGPPEWLHDTVVQFLIGPL